MKQIFYIIFAVVVLLSVIPQADAEAKYTREKSEELFPLIDWHNYTPSTFEKALGEQKPIFLMISAPAWCYWCHVYESEDYLYHPDLYPYINENFISVFVDSDKRPDLTRKYLEGGWPSTTIFTPDLRRINGYVGPRDPKGLKDYLEQLVEYLKDKTFSGFSQELAYEESEERIPSISELDRIQDYYKAILTSNFDDEFGGFVNKNAASWRSGQKFPQGYALTFLLEQYDEKKNADYLGMVTRTFNNQYTSLDELETRYHLYDPVEGGFHRYSTNRDWTIPHYEKMLYDQAKLIRAYAGLYAITQDTAVFEAVNKSASFVLAKLYDPEGGFYASQDAYIEDSYFSLLEEERNKIEPPFVDHTRNIDSNSQMISTFFYLDEIFNDKLYKRTAAKSLDFIQSNMIGDEGASYYFDFDRKQAFLSGQSVSNSWALLAFVEGYSYTDDKAYLETARQIADYALADLYDWNSGGFFERNSKDTEFYAPNERIDLSKPYEENAVFSYALLRLYSITKKDEYLESGIKTLGYLTTKQSGFDQTYYAAKAAQWASEQDLLQAYEKEKNKLENIKLQKQKTFFLDALLRKDTDQVSIKDAPKLVDEFTDTAFIILAILAFAAGILSLLSPCSLPVLTAYFTQGLHAKKGEMIKNTLLFFLGLALVFSIFGMGATYLGSMFRDNRIIFTQVAGLGIIAFGIMQLAGKGFAGLHLKMGSKKKTPLGQILFGILFGIGWSACIGPILASLLLLSATTGTIAIGSSLLFIYALGLGIPLIIISLYFDKIKNKRFWEILQGRLIPVKFLGKEMHIHTTSIISGILLITIGILIFNDYLYKLNQFALQTAWVQNTIINGEEFLKRLLL